jgi:hypothetical protein
MTAAVDFFALSPPDYQDIGLEHWLLALRGRYDRTGARLADDHYSRRTRGAPAFIGPGNVIVLISRDHLSVFAWWRPDPDTGPPAMNGLNGWTCTIFRRTGGPRASDLILDAECAIDACKLDCGPDGLITYGGRRRGEAVTTSQRHPANRGLVMLAAWVEPVLRDHVRERAREAGVTLSQWIADALRRESVRQTAERALRDSSASYGRDFADDNEPKPKPAGSTPEG